MVVRTAVAASLVFMTCIVVGRAQTNASPQPSQGRGTLLPPARVPATPTPAAPAAAQARSQPVNVKIDFTITDQRAGAAPVKRTLSVVTADGQLGRVRTTSKVNWRGGDLDVPLNVDATPSLLTGGEIRVQFTVSYDVPYFTGATAAPNAQGEVSRSTLSDSVTLVLKDGASVTAAQSADPIGDRQVSVDVKATVMK